MGQSIDNQSTSIHQTKVLIIGNGMVGHYFVEQLLLQQATVSICVLSGESRPAYDRVHLSEFFSGKTEQDLLLTTEQEYIDKGVEFHSNSKVD